ncbi:MAG: hypothetical protein G01um101420_85 [Parcubacteria group bacterium Gr01-1014_20]|nr:MAG: hypothetical protein G01um101420_85 [Parcubacteria group bacterium Gr01-1014_20]
MSMETPRGMRMVASAGETDPSRLPKANDECKVIESSDKTCTFDCGHKGPEWFTLAIYGERFNEVRNAKWGMCPDCFIPFFKKMTIRCVRCRLVILPGMAVALYDDNSEGLYLDIATRDKDGGVFGCMRWHCCPSGGFLAGHWSEQGFQPLFGGRTGSEFSAETNTIVEVDDIQNPK